MGCAYGTETVICAHVFLTVIILRFTLNRRALSGLGSAILLPLYPYMMNIAMIFSTCVKDPAFPGSKSWMMHQLSFEPCILLL